MFYRTICTVIFINIISRTFNAIARNSDEWRVVEALAEEHPYIVALLNISKMYTCSGTIISKRSVLTSGYCTDPEPMYVAVGLAVISSKNCSNIIKVAYTKLHSDYTFAMRDSEPNITRMHSNIGLVFVVRAMLTVFIMPAPIGSYYASELRSAELTSIGYGRRYHRGDTITLQYQKYDQSPCVNPRWYYCICGTEVPSTIPTYDRDFGDGAPALYGNDVVGITAAITGTLFLKPHVKYNIFTVIGPYIPWIEKSETRFISRRASNEAGHIINYNTLVNFIYILLLIR